MADRRISDYLQGTRTPSTAAQNHLRQLVERYPYFHAARIVYLKMLYQAHDPSFGSELRKAALYVPSHQVLYAMAEGERLNPATYAQTKNVHQKKAAGHSVDRTESLIGQFLDQMEDPKPRHTSKVDATVDYIEYLRQSGTESKVLYPSCQKSTTNDVIDAFLDNDVKIQIHEHTDDELLRPQEQEGEMGSGDVLTEMMAKIYIKQEKYDKALEIIRRLYLKYPKKNRYFADQMRFLQKIIINNKNK
ncbi:MAG: hypothetical protein K2F69_00975 [Bacteroidaceae bacterium]|nr:hypothetical protein [Bacteroidaceae bacterium]